MDSNTTLRDCGSQNKLDNKPSKSSEKSLSKFSFKSIADAFKKKKYPTAYSSDESLSGLTIQNLQKEHSKTSLKKQITANNSLTASKSSLQNDLKGKKKHGKESPNKKKSAKSNVFAQPSGSSLQLDNRLLTQRLANVLDGNDNCEKYTSKKFDNPAATKRLVTMLQQKIGHDSICESSLEKKKAQCAKIFANFVKTVATESPNKSAPQSNVQDRFDHMGRYIAEFMNDTIKCQCDKSLALAQESLGIQQERSANLPIYPDISAQKLRKNKKKKIKASKKECKGETNCTCACCKRKAYGPAWNTSPHKKCNKKQANKICKTVQACKFLNFDQMLQWNECLKQRKGIVDKPKKPVPTAVKKLAKPITTDYRKQPAKPLANKAISCSMFNQTTPRQSFASSEAPNKRLSDCVKKRKEQEEGSDTKMNTLTIKICSPNKLKTNFQNETVCTSKNTDCVKKKNNCQCKKKSSNGLVNDKSVNSNQTSLCDSFTVDIEEAEEVQISPKQELSKCARAKARREEKKRQIQPTNDLNKSKSSDIRSMKQKYERINKQRRSASKEHESSAAKNRGVKERDTAAVKKHGSAAASERSSPDAKDRKLRAATKERTTPAFKNRASPSVNDHASPAAKDRASPAVKDRAAPAVKDRAAPAVKPHTSSASKNRESPAVKDNAARTAKGHTLSTVKERVPTTTKDHAAPAVKSHASRAVSDRSAAVKDRSIKNVKDRTSPAAKDRAAPTDKRRESLTRKDPNYREGREVSAAKKRRSSTTKELPNTSSLSKETSMIVTSKTQIQSRIKIANTISDLELSMPNVSSPAKETSMTAMSTTQLKTYTKLTKTDSKQDKNVEQKILNVLHNQPPNKFFARREAKDKTKSNKHLITTASSEDIDHFMPPEDINQVYTHTETILDNSEKALKCLADFNCLEDFKGYQEEDNCSCYSSCSVLIRNLNLNVCCCSEESIKKETKTAKTEKSKVEKQHCACEQKSKPTKKRVKKKKCKPLLERDDVSACCLKKIFSTESCKKKPKGICQAKPKIKDFCQTDAPDDKKMLVAIHNEEKLLKLQQHCWSLRYPEMCSFTQY